jgi:hypothetical protein
MLKIAAIFHLPSLPPDVTPRAPPLRAMTRTQSCPASYVSLFVTLGAVFEGFPALLDILTRALHRVARTQH